jgi:prepilin-type N-terminal cleavage/methylation domain-containing protein
MKRNAFTLVELLVVIAIIGLLSSIAIVSMSGSRDKARIAAGRQSDMNIEHALGADSVGYWPFEEGSGITTSDGTGNGNNGTLSAASTWVAGAKGNAINFDGSNYVTMSKSISLSSNAFTATAWFKTLNAGDIKIFSTSVSHHQISLYSGSLRFCGDQCVSGGPNYADGAWHFAVITGDSASIRGYVDGRLSLTHPASATIMSGIPRIGAAGAGAGGDVASTRFIGSIDEVKAYPQAMTAMEIRDMHIAGSAERHDPLAVR